MNLLPKIMFPAKNSDDAVERELMRAEARLGGQLFGPVPTGHDRQFFCLDEHTWIWHEEWQAQGRTQRITTRYEVRPNGILKLQTGKPYQRLSDGEARNLYRAMGLYGQRVGAYYQRMLQTA